MVSWKKNVLTWVAHFQIQTYHIDRDGENLKNYKRYIFHYYYFFFFSSISKIRMARYCWALILTHLSRHFQGFGATRTYILYPRFSVDSWKFFARTGRAQGCRRRRRRHHSTSSLHRMTTVVRMGKLRVSRRARLFLYPPPSSGTNSRIRPATNPGLLARTCSFTTGESVYVSACVCVWMYFGCLSPL